MSEQLAIKKIRMDGGTQPRAELREDVIDDYAEAWDAGADFPPVVVFFDGKAHWLADGFHRVHGAQKAGAVAMACEVHQGEKRDAVLYACGANADHGLRRTNGDKHRAVETLLRDDEWGNWSNVEIGKRCHVDQSTVKRIRDEVSPLQSKSEKRQYTTKHGTVAEMDTSRIGSRPGATEGSSGATEAVVEDAPVESKPKRRGRGVELAHNAINILMKIPRNDALRDEGLKTVARWIRDNK